MTNLLNRRAALGALAAAGAVLATSEVAETSSPDTLSALIADHRKKREAFCLAIDEADAASPPHDAWVKGFGGCDYELSRGKDSITERINCHFRHLASPLSVVAEVSPNVGAEALAILECERDAAFARVDEAFVAEDAAELRRKDASDAEEAALLAICAYRCSPGELEQKFGISRRIRTNCLMSSAKRFSPRSQPVGRPDHGARPANNAPESRRRAYRLGRAWTAHIAGRSPPSARRLSPTTTRELTPRSRRDDGARDRRRPQARRRAGRRQRGRARR